MYALLSSSSRDEKLKIRHIQHEILNFPLNIISIEFTVLSGTYYRSLLISWIFCILIALQNVHLCMLFQVVMKVFSCYGVSRKVFVEKRRCGPFLLPYLDVIFYKRILLSTYFLGLYLFNQCLKISTLNILSSKIIKFVENRYTNILIYSHETFAHIHTWNSLQRYLPVSS